MLERIERIISKYSEKKIALVPEMSLISDLELNSLDIASMICDIEDEFDCEINDEDLYRIETVKELLEIIRRSGNP